MITNPYTQALAWALVHFLWQGAAIGLVAVVIWRYARLSASSKYGIGVALLAAMLAAPLATFTYLARSANDAGYAGTQVRGYAGTQVRGDAGTNAATTANTASAEQTAHASTPGLTLRPIALGSVLVLWLVGVGVFSVRLLGGWIAVRRLARRTVRPAGADIQALARRVAGRLALDRMVGIFESAAVSVPVMVGWVKPAVLLPAAALTGLSTVQLESLLAHELAHVRRHDYLVNLLQGLVETLLFYHPAVWWLSRQVRREREHCCDDLAVGVCDRLVYATALADLASLTAPRSFALAATDGSLLDRVRRILGQKGDERASTSPWLPVSFVGLIAVAVLPIAFVSAQAPETRPRVEPVAPVVVTAQRKPIVPVEIVPAESAQAAREIVSVAVPEEVVAAVSDQDRSEMAGKIAEIRRQLEDTRDRVAIAAQQGAEQSQIDDLRKRLAALEQQLAKMLVEQRGRTEESKQLTAAQEALLKARQQAVERDADRIKMLYEKGLATEGQMRRAELDKQREMLEQVYKERTAMSEEAQAKIKQQFEELNKAMLEKQLDRSKTLTEKGLMSQRDYQRAEEAFRQKLADARLLSQLGFAESDIDDSRLSEDARKLISRALDEKASDDDVTAVFKNVTTLKEDHDRAAVLVRIARERPFTAGMVSVYLSAANSIRSDYDRERVFRQAIQLKGR